MNPGLPPFLHDLLDRRADPFADAAARAWFLEHPEALERFAALRRELSALPRPAAPMPRPAAPMPHVRPRWPWFVAAAMAAVAASIVVAGFAAQANEPAAPRDAAPLPRPEFAPAAIRSWSAATRELEAARTLELRLDGHTRLQTERMRCATDERTLTVTARTIRQTTTAP